MFEFSTSARILFGNGTIERLPEIVRGLGTKILLVVGASRERVPSAIEPLDQGGSIAEWLPVRREPTIADIENGVQLARDHRVNVVVAIGGGSVLDTGKAIAAIATNPGELLDYLEVVGRGRPLLERGLPCVAVPTTSGTGSEVTRNAVIDVPEHRTKVSLRSEQLLPKVALLDPALTLSVPPQVTAATGFDAFVQILEPYVSNRANPMTDALAVAGLPMVSQSLRRAFTNGSDAAARSDLALISLWGGMCLANARLGAVHAMAGPIGAMFHAPHGAICAALLVPVMRANVRALRRQPSDHPALARYRTVARLLTANESASIEDGIAWVEQLAKELKIRGLGELGVTVDSFGEITARAARASSMQGNPVDLAPPEISAILETAL